MASLCWPLAVSPPAASLPAGDTAELFKWLDVRDTLLGDNYKAQDITAALALARDCKHPDAEWLTSIFEGKDVATKEDAREVFLSLENDARALCFAWWLSENAPDDLSPLLRAAELGEPFAQGLWLYFSDFERLEDYEESLLQAFTLASVGERLGYFIVGKLLVGSLVQQHRAIFKPYLLVAAKLGLVEAWSLLAEQVQSPECWHFAGKAWTLKKYFPLASEFAHEVEQFFSSSAPDENAAVVFLIGRALKGNIDMEKKEIFGNNHEFNSRVGPANQAVSFYDSQIKSARLAVDTWTLVATRLRVIKDMRIYIGKMIWDARFEANYSISSENLFYCSTFQPQNQKIKRAKKK